MQPTVAMSTHAMNTTGEEEESVYTWWMGIRCLLTRVCKQVVFYEGPVRELKVVLPEVHREVAKISGAPFQ